MLEDTNSFDRAQMVLLTVSDNTRLGPGFETYRRRVVSLSKTLYSPKVLVNYPGSGGMTEKLLTGTLSLNTTNQH